MATMIDTGFEPIETAMERYWRTEAKTFRGALKAISKGDPNWQEIARRAVYGEKTECSICRRSHGREVEHACE